ncbi:MAG: hypothetical protein RLZZ303_1941 [Candidatus Hydrogenedentota bacterium]|jgi:hypothetical protein
MLLARRLFLAALLYAALPLLLLTVLELGLRAAGVGSSTAWLLRRECDSAGVFTPNRAFYQQFSRIPIRDFLNWDELDFVLPAEKDSDTIRIFAFGESALFGERSAVRMLEVMLADRFPERDFEVYNASCPGMNSHVLRRTAAEAAAFSPDCFVIYMGNNEAIGPYGASTAMPSLGPLWSPPVVQALIALNDLRLVQWATARGNRPWASPTPEQLAASVPGMVDHDRVNDLFQLNLTAMLETANDSGAASVVCTLSHNRSFGAPGLTPDSPAGTPLNQIAMSTAKSMGAELANVDQALHDAAPGGTPDYEFFTDNIHFRFEGNYVVACAMFDAVLNALAPKLPKALPPPRDRVAELLAWTPAAEAALLRLQINAGFDEPSKQKLRERLVELEGGAVDLSVVAIAQGYENALALRPSDLQLLRGWFDASFHGGMHAEAAEAAEAMKRRQPCACATLRAEARVAGLRAEPDRARALFERLLEVYPGDEPALAALGMLP